jgi:hypothetical protein
MIGWYRDLDLQPQYHLAKVLHSCMRQGTLAKVTEQKEGLTALKIWVVSAARRLL